MKLFVIINSVLFFTLLKRNLETTPSEIPIPVDFPNLNSKGYRSINHFRRKLGIIAINTYCNFIPASYREEAYSDLLHTFRNKPFSRAIVDLREYTTGALDYKWTQLSEILRWRLFAIRRYISRTKIDFRILNE